MRKVDKTLFWSLLHKQKRDVVSKVVGSYPYTVVFSYRHGGLFGKIKEISVKGVYPTVEEYYISDEVKA